MNEAWSRWLEQLNQAAAGAAQPPEAMQLAELLQDADAPLAQFADDLVGAAQAGRLPASWWRASLGLVARAGGRFTDQDAAIAPLCKLNRQLREGEPMAAALILQTLAWAGSDASLSAFAELIGEDPPREERALGLAFSPLFQRPSYDPLPLFPELLEALQHPQAAAVVLDLTNFLTRQARVAQHPATARRPQLAALLAQIVNELLSLEQNPGQVRGDDLPRMVSSGVALAVSLCDALGLIGDPESSPALRAALQPRHRRLRSEASAALARLGDAEGVETLIGLAAEPIARLRVLHYAQELGLLHRVPPEFRTPVAEAEAALVVWLAEPTQFGAAPRSCELYDQRTLSWPGDDEPTPCYLFRFAYTIGEQVMANIGISGPLVFALGADLTDLPPEDIYAVYAGWQTEHEDIYEVQASQLETHHLAEIARLERRLRDDGYEPGKTAFLGFFFGQKVLVTAASRQGVRGVAVVDEQDVWWRATPEQGRGLGPQEAYCIYKGRKVLRAFNE